MQSTFRDWMNKAVVLHVTLNDWLIPLRGTVVGESVDAVRFRLGETWDVDVYKSMILAVDKDD